MPDTIQVTQVVPITKTVGLFQDPHFWGVVNTAGGLVTLATSYLVIIPTPIQPFVLAAGAIWTVGAQIFHIFGLVNPESTQTDVVKTVAPLTPAVTTQLVAEAAIAPPAVKP